MSSKVNHTRGRRTRKSANPMSKPPRVDNSDSISTIHRLNLSSVDDSQFLSADDILNSGKEGFYAEIPEMPRPDGKPGAVFICAPNALIVAEIFGEGSTAESANQIRTSTKVERVKHTARMIAAFVRNKDGSRMFTPAQVERLCEVKLDLFNRLGRLVNEAFADEEEETGDTKTAENEDGQSSNPFVETVSSDSPTDGGLTSESSTLTKP